MVVSVYASGQARLRIAVLGMKRAAKESRKKINDAMRAEFNPIWKKAVAENLGGFHAADTMMTRGTRISAGNPPALIAASSTRTFGRALKPADNWPLVEFGVGGNRQTTYTRRSKNGGSHKVTRHTMTGWPRRIRTGRIATPAAGDLIPRIRSYWIQSVIRTLADALDEGAH